ncbi:LytTR family DNA-binding domain-containing protein [Candidatus Halobeggiatoa sp. HSG11]|nr:LytTR family DNA-binding domain-containing protein [Candidatus Halobeggiatoa sp. HSG11]
MIKVIIVDDEPLARKRLRALVDEIGIATVVAEADNGKDALLLYELYQPDVVLLDIHLPEIDGMQIAKQLISTIIIFTTAYSQHALEAFEHQAIDYLVKPIRKERLEQALKRAYNFLPNLPTARTHISYFKRGEKSLIAVNKIYYFLAQENYTMLRWQNGEILINETLKDLEQEFANQFLRIHRRFLISIYQIEALVKEKNGHFHIRLKDVSETLEVSRRQLPTVNKFFKNTTINS